MSFIDASTVIIKRLPHMVTNDGVISDIIDTGRPCDCIDDLFNVPSPSCKHCGGSGIIREHTTTVQEVVTTTTGTKTSWITSAEIIVDNTGNVIYDEDDVISAVHIFFSLSEDIQVGDIVVPSGQQISYVVRDVRDDETINKKDCAAEVYVPPIN